ncbi:Apurinic endonuclease-redox protein [Acorus calamus]|uniref:DNA-(apurinic or apyrimidinic site) endonuclease n=1 Tax=Acorus calamus TaxID=4465 RepID=A0AAV9CVE1_ACOCL|nr:Apurinic endonuclease-redox protein [Acorus calamus]
MGSKRLRSNASAAASTSSDGVTIKDLGGPTNSVDKEDMTRSHGGLDDFRDDLSKLEGLTVKDLRKLMREAGIPTRGNKQELVSALKSFLLGREAANGTPSSPAVARDTPSLVPPEDGSPKRKSKNDSVTQNVVTISEVSASKQKKSRDEVQLDENLTLKEYTRTVTTKQKGLANIRPSHAKRKAPSRVKNDDEEPPDRLGQPLTSVEPWTVLAHKKPQKGWVPYSPTTMRPPPLGNDTRSVKLMSWNVNGLRALLKLETFSALQLAQEENFDVLCLQETKLQEKDVEDIKDRLIDGYDNSFWTCSVSKLGYSGTAIISRIKPISVKYGLGVLDHDSEGRLVTVEFDTFYLICGYVPNSGDGLKRLTYRIEQWDTSLSNYMKELEKSKPVILTGDLNCAHQEIDIFNPAGNRRSAGFTDEERKSFELNFLSRGFVDTFRKQHPDVVGYTYWGFRHNGRKTNKGWRLDYFLVSESIADKVHDSYILPHVTGSDHCPIGLILKL